MQAKLSKHYSDRNLCESAWKLIRPYLIVLFAANMFCEVCIAIPERVEIIEAIRSSSGAGWIKQNRCWINVLVL